MRFFDFFFRGLFLPSVFIWSASQLVKEVRDLGREIRRGDLTERTLRGPGVHW